MISVFGFGFLINYSLWPLTWKNTDSRCRHRINHAYQQNNICEKYEAGHLFNFLFRECMWAISYAYDLTGHIINCKAWAFEDVGFRSFHFWVDFWVKFYILLDRGHMIMLATFLTNAFLTDHHARCKKHFDTIFRNCSATPWRIFPFTSGQNWQ